MSFKKENEVLAAALDEFSSKSYDESSLNSIIQESGISKGAFYHHFKNKYDIYIYVLKDSISKKWKFINENNRLEPKDNIFDLLHDQIKIGNEFGNKHPIYASLYNMFVKEKNNEIYSKVINDLGVDEQKGLETLLEKAINENQFNDVYSKDFIQTIMTFFFRSYNDIFENNDHIELFIEFLRNGLSS